MLTSIAEDIKRNYQNGSALTRIILINIGVFVAVNLIFLFATYGNAGVTPAWYISVMNYLSLSSEMSEVIWRPWSVITHMILHQGFWHLLWNMLFLYWFGRIVGDLIGNDKVLPLYVLGALMGAVFYFLSANILAYGEGVVHYAMGASAASMAMVVAAATLSPDYNMRLLLIGNVKLKYIAVALIFLDLIGTAGNMNTGGHFGHLGGALMGYLYIDQMRKGNNLGVWFEHFFSKKWFSRSGPLKVVHFNEEKMTDSALRTEEEELNRVLDKIKAEGMGSLSAQEKAFLKKMSES